jgi:hypothetical protein
MNVHLQAEDFLVDQQQKITKFVYNSTSSDPNKVTFGKIRHVLKAQILERPSE